jgi:hypothetical protein
LNIAWNGIPPRVVYDPSIQYDNRGLRAKARRQKTRHLCLVRSGNRSNDPRVDLRICNIHKRQNETVLVQYRNTKNKIKLFKTTLCLPVSEGVAHVPSTNTRGIGIDREVDRAITLATQEVVDSGGDIDAVMRLMLLWSYKAPNEQVYRQEQFGVVRSSEVQASKVVIKIEDLTDFRVHMQTGFPSLLALLSFIAIVCDGDIDTVTKSETELTWLEEWYLYFEVLYGKTIGRWVDAADKYKSSDRTLRTIYDRKLKHVLDARNIWPRYVTMKEDETYCKPDKWEAYEGKRVIMFDNTNIIVRQPSNADAQRITYSLYYAGNVGKGAVFIQPCGWMGSHEIWSGGVSDTMYMQKGEVFDTLNKFILNHETDEEIQKVRFTIILDKGYWIVSDAFNEGGHFTLQPIFAEVDRHFTTLEVIHTSSVATDRSGNERAVRYLKISDYLSKGLITNESVERLCDTWLAWGYQVNFMYKPVH